MQESEEKSVDFGMIVFCHECKKMAPWHNEGSEMVCDWCGFRADINWTREFGRLSKGTIPVRQEQPV